MKRLRLLIYECDDPLRIAEQRQRDGIKDSHTWGSGENAMTITSIELNPLRITLLQLFRLFRREGN